MLVGRNLPKVSAGSILLIYIYIYYFNWNFPFFPRQFTSSSTFMTHVGFFYFFLVVSWACSAHPKESSRLHVSGLPSPAVLSHAQFGLFPIWSPLGLQGLDTEPWGHEFGAGMAPGLHRIKPWHPCEFCYGMWKCWPLVRKKHQENNRAVVQRALCFITDV